MKKIPFPQANTFTWLYEILFIIQEQGISKFTVSKKYNIDDRQGAYYLDALYFLDLVEKQDERYFLSSQGIEIKESNTPFKDFCKYVMSNSKMCVLYTSWNEHDNNKDKINRLTELIASSYGYTGTTPGRRASTINGWFKIIKKELDNNE